MQPLLWLGLASSAVSACAPPALAPSSKTTSAKAEELPTAKRAEVTSTPSLAAAPLSRLTPEQARPTKMEINWLDNDRFSIAEGYVVNASDMCLSMPFEGKDIEVCESALWSNNGPASENDTTTLPQQNPEASMSAWIDDKNRFCVRRENEQDCYSVPRLGIPDHLLDDGFFVFLATMSDSVYVRKDLLPLFDSAPGDAFLCAELKIEINRRSGHTTLVGPKRSVKDRIVEDTFSVGFGSMITLIPGSRSYLPGGFGVVSGSLACGPSIGVLTARSRDFAELSHKDTRYRWYRERSACEKAAPKRFARMKPGCGEPSS